MNGRILIIDDDADFREAISTLLEVKGYKVSIARSGDEGLLKAAEENPDLVLLDVMMGSRTEGITVARKMHQGERTKSIPVIITTGIRRDMNLSFELEPDEKHLPVEAVLEKPVRPGTLFKMIESHIRT